MAPFCSPSSRLYFFGGPVLNDFAFSFLVGVIVGTYSSIFIASPIVLWWTRARGKSTASLRREVTQADHQRKSDRPLGQIQARI